MNIQALVGRRARLVREFVAAAEMRPLPYGMLRRLSHDLAVTICRIAAVESRRG